MEYLYIFLFLLFIYYMRKSWGCRGAGLQGCDATGVSSFPTRENVLLLLRQKPSVEFCHSSGERSILILDSLRLPCCKRDTADLIFNLKIYLKVESYIAFSKCIVYTKWCSSICVIQRKLEFLTFNISFYETFFYKGSALMELTF